MSYATFEQTVQLVLITSLQTWSKWLQIIWGLRSLMSSTPVSRTCTFYLLGSSRASARFLKGAKLNPRKTYDLYQYTSAFKGLWTTDFPSAVCFIDKNNVLNNKISAYRKAQSTTTVLQAIRDDIVKAMKRSEVTMMILAEFSKAFDTICFRNLISKMSKLGFPRDFLIWTLNYITHRKQFI